MCRSFSGSGSKMVTHRLLTELAVKEAYSRQREELAVAIVYLVIKMMAKRTEESKYQSRREDSTNMEFNHVQQ